MSSRWDTPEDAAETARLKAEKAAKKAAREERRRRDAEATAAAAAASSPPPSKRHKVSEPSDAVLPAPGEPKLLRFPTVSISSCRHVETSYERLNHIEEGSYGVVSRAKDLETSEVVALKRLKLDRETDGFPITSLREIQTLMAARHPNVVNIREVVMGDSLKEYTPLLPSSHTHNISNPVAKKVYT
jgi:cell division cycle 2-like protein